MPSPRIGRPAAAAAGRLPHVQTAGPGRPRQDPAHGLATRPRRERGLGSAYPDVRRRRHGEHADAYTATVPVLGYAARRVTVVIDRRGPDLARVYADGTTLSPHRHAGRNRTELCIWHPYDPPDRRWAAEDGITALLAMAGVHLFKEAWWRETREWLGEEAPHPADEPAPDLLPDLVPA